MELHNKNTSVCAHCGYDNSKTSGIWLDQMDEEKKESCHKCNRLLVNENLNDSPATIPEPSSAADLSDNNNGNIKFWIITAGLTGFILFLNHTFNTSIEAGEIIYGILIVLIISSTLAFGKMMQKLKHLMIWGVIFLLMLTGYSYRHELLQVKDKVLGELIPENGFQKTSDSISFQASSDGHFYIRATVNGTPVKFLADTGASHIVLTPATAERLGFDPDRLVFNRLYNTANGKVRGSSVRIQNFMVGNFHLKEIGASVNEADMSHSLLGMTFFKRLEKYEVKNNTLTLFWKKNY